MLQSLVASHLIWCPPPRLHICLKSPRTITSNRYQLFTRTFNRIRCKMSQKERSRWRALELDRGQLCTVQCSAHTVGCARLPHSPTLGSALHSAHTAACAQVPHCPTLGTAPPVAAAGALPPMQTNNRLPPPRERWNTIPMKYYLTHPNVGPCLPRITLPIYNMPQPHPPPYYLLGLNRWWFMTTDVCVRFQRIYIQYFLKWGQPRVLH